AAGRGHAGDIGDTLRHQAVRPGFRLRLADVRTDGAYDAAHGSGSSQADPSLASRADRRKRVGQPPRILVTEDDPQTPLAVLRPGLGVVVSPLIALMKDQVDSLRQAGVRAAALNSGLPAGEAGRIERAARDGALDLLYVSPERLAMPHCIELLRQSRIALFA